MASATTSALLHATVSSPGAPDVEFDTESTDEPQGFAAMVAPLLREMAGSEIVVTATARGEATEVRIPEPLAAAIAAGPGADGQHPLSRRELRETEEGER